jgi:hypothetical protein
MPLKTANGKKLGQCTELLKMQGVARNVRLVK